MSEEIRKLTKNKGKQNLRPKKGVQEALIREIERGVINDPILKHCKLDLSGEPFKLYTITVMFLYACTVYLDTHDYLDVGGLLILEPDSRTNVTAEKTGNRVGTVVPGEIVNAIVSRTPINLGMLDIALGGTIIHVPVVKDFTEEDRITLGFIQTQTAKLLSGYQYGINPEDWNIYIVTLLFIQHAALVAMRNAAGHKSHECEIEILDVMTIKVEYNPKKDKFTFLCDPSKDSKLNVKSDSTTER